MGEDICLWAGDPEPNDGSLYSFSNLGSYGVKLILSSKAIYIDKLQYN